MSWNSTTKEPCGFHQYWCNRNRSPEECTEGALLNEKIDVYGLGNFIHFLITRHLPYHSFHGTKEEIHESIMKGLPPPLPYSLSQNKNIVIEALLNAMNQCHVKDPKKRPNAIDVAAELEKVYISLSVEAN